MPAPLAAAWPGLSAAIRAGRPLLLYSDFDGTLVPIHETPFECEAPPEVRAALAELAGRQGVSVAVVSGRDLADLRPRVGVVGIAYAGNHGLEIHTPVSEFVHPQARTRRDELADLLAAVTSAVAVVPGAWVQDKGLTASVHFRQSPPDRVPEVTAAVERVVGPRLDRFALRPGKMVLEIRPKVDWHKGRAVTWLRDHFAPLDPSAVPIYMGDDVTDEDAFAVLPDGVTVLVGPDRPTAARYRADAPADVAAFLTQLAAEFSC